MSVKEDFYIARKVAMKEVQHGTESTPISWTASGRPATPQKASVDVRNETARITTQTVTVGGHIYGG